LIDRDVELSVGLDAQCRTPRLVVIGQIDTATIDQFDHAVRSAVRCCPRLIIDLSGVEFLSSSGVATLFVHLDHIVAVRVVAAGIVARALSQAGYPHLILDAERGMSDSAR
jgi:anti-anti-sigma factor